MTKLKVLEYGMLGRDIKPDELDECICAVWQEAAKKLPPGLACPSCGARVETFVDTAASEDGLTVLGEHNGATDEQRFFRAVVAECDGCGEEYALFPMPVIWNANHDVHYTGRGSYLPIRADGQALGLMVRDAVKPKIQQWIERRATGENLDGLHLEIWLEYAVERVVAEVLNMPAPEMKHAPGFPELDASHAPPKREL